MFMLEDYSSIIYMGKCLKSARYCYITYGLSRGSIYISFLIRGNISNTYFY